MSTDEVFRYGVLALLLGPMALAFIIWWLKIFWDIIRAILDS